MMTTDRDQFVGGNVTDSVASALKAEAKREKTSVSHLLYHILQEWLETRGYEEENTPGCCK